MKKKEGKISVEEIKERGIRKPNPSIKLGNLADWIERILELPEGAISCVNPDGNIAGRQETLGTLSKKYESL